jgi:hypothetical protein
MKIANIFKLPVLILGGIGLVGCSTHTVTTNKMIGIPTPSISTMNSIADVEIGESISGEACSREFFYIFESGDNKFLELYGNANSGPKDKAKAAAAYKALITGKGISTDIIVHPIWEITRDRTLFGLVSDEYCAKVAGFRGQIKGFKKSQTLTDPPEKRASESFFGRLFSLNDMSEKH